MIYYNNGFNPELEIRGLNWVLLIKVNTYFPCPKYKMQKVLRLMYENDITFDLTNVLASLVIELEDMIKHIEFQPIRDKLKRNILHIKTFNGLYGQI